MDFVQAWTQQKMTKLEVAIETGSKSDEFQISRTATTTARTSATTAGVRKDAAKLDKSAVTETMCLSMINNYCFLTLVIRPPGWG